MQEEEKIRKRVREMRWRKWAFDGHNKKQSKESKNQEEEEEDKKRTWREEETDRGHNKTRKRQTSRHSFDRTASDKSTTEYKNYIRKNKNRTTRTGREKQTDSSKRDEELKQDRDIPVLTQPHLQSFEEGTLFLSHSFMRRILSKRERVKASRKYLGCKDEISGDLILYELFHCLSWWHNPFHDHSIHLIMNKWSEADQESLGITFSPTRYTNRSGQKINEIEERWEKGIRDQSLFSTLYWKTWSLGPTKHSFPTFFERESFASSIFLSSSSSYASFVHRLWGSFCHFL